MRRTSTLVVFAACLFSAELAAAASLEKAALYMRRGEMREARKQYTAVIRKGDARERETAYLGLAKAYFLEKDFQSVLRSLEPVEGRILDSKNGAWIRILLYRSARAVGHKEIAARHYQALIHSRQDFSMADVMDHLRDLRTVGLLNKSYALQMDTGADSARRANFSVAESLIGFEIVQGASRMWLALASSRLDDVGRTALQRLGQSLDWEGAGPEAGRVLKLYVLLFAEDPGAADALYRLWKWSTGLGDPGRMEGASLLAEFYPTTLYGAMAVIDMAWTWPDKDRIRAVLRSVKESPGLPEPLLERGLAALIDHPAGTVEPDELSWAAGRYLAAFPHGPAAAAARALKK